MKSQLTQQLSLSDQAYALLLSRCSHHVYPRHSLILEPGNRVDKLFFIEKGLLRGYRLVEGSDITHHFYLENWFATDYESYLLETPGELFIETLTPVSLYAFTRQAMEALYAEHPVFERMGRIMAERAYLTMVARFKSFQTQTLGERYESLVRLHPTLFQQVPQKYIASYLGVAPQSLSRIKGKR